MELQGLDAQAFAYAERWCAAKGPEWTVVSILGRGGTAPVFLVEGSAGRFAFKLLDPKFSTGDLGRQTEGRITQQVQLGNHGCSNLIICYDGGKFEDRLFLLMALAEGQELEKRLADVPRTKIRNIVDQIAKAVIFLRSKGLCHRDIKSANVFVSDDFDRVTLLDLSVIRGIYDPIGVGTDHDNQLPVVATSRYSPPEYLFRLQEPSAELWHGLDVYQLGGILHDLIMREPLYNSEYASSSENRYRFAWIVATVDPDIRALDVDADLVLLARRALDKNWDRRRLVRLEDFLIEEGRESQALAAIGIAAGTRAVAKLPDTPKPGTVKALAKRLDEKITEYFNQKKLRVTHNLKSGHHDFRIILEYGWELGEDNFARIVELVVDLEVRLTEPRARVGLSLRFSASIDGETSLNYS